MTQMDKIVVGMVIAILVMFIVNAIRFYIHSYKGRFYSYLYSNFLEYYFKYTNRNNVSTSAYLKNQIGPHKMVFNSYLNAQKRPVHDFVTIFHSKGILVCYIVTSAGDISGKISNAHLVVKRDGKLYQIPGPKEGIDKHVAMIKQKCGDNVPIEVCLFFKPKNTEFENVISNYKKATYKEVTKICSEMTYSLREDEIENYYSSCTTHLVKQEEEK